MKQHGQIFLYGSGGHAKVVLDILRLREAAVAVLLDDDETRTNMDVMGVPVVQAQDALETLRGQEVLYGIIAIGDNQLRREKAELIRAKGYELLSAVHPKAVIADSVEIGAGTTVMAGVIVNWDAQIGENVILNTGCTVDHDCIIGDGAHLSPGVNLGGNVKIGDGAHVGIGASVLPGIKIGANTIIGGGAVVTQNLPCGVTAVGVPAKVIRQHE